MRNTLPCPDVIKVCTALGIRFSFYRKGTLQLWAKLFQIITSHMSRNWGGAGSWNRSVWKVGVCTVYPKKYAHGFVVHCFVVVMQLFIMNSHEVIIHIHQGCFAGTGAVVRLPHCQWSKPDGYGKISQCITTTKHSKAKTCAYFLGYTVCMSYIAIPCLFMIWRRKALRHQ